MKKYNLVLRLAFLLLCAGGALSALTAARADVGSSLTLLPSSNGVDNVSGATNTSWVFTATTTADLHSGDIIRFGFPTVISGDQFSLTNATTTAQSGISLFSHVTSTIGNLFTNTTFNATVTPWADVLAGLGGSEFSVTSTSAEGAGALSMVAIGNGFNGSMLHQDKHVAPSSDYTFSFYARSAGSDGVARFLIFSTSTVACDSGYIMAYNFVSSTTEAPVWQCIGQMSPGSYASTSPYVKNFAVTSTFARFSETFRVSSTISYIDLNIIAGLDASYVGQEIIYDAVELEEGLVLNGYDADPHTVSSTPGVGIDNNAKVLYGFVGADLSSGSNFSVTFGGITNASSSYADTQNLSWPVNAGTLFHTTVVTSSLSAIALAATSTESLIRHTPSTISDLSLSGITTSQVVLNWSSSTYANYYAVFRSSSISVNTSTDLIATSSVATYTNSGLSSSTTYYFAVVGVNETSTGTISNIASTTTARPTPSTISDLALSAVTTDQAVLSWSSSTNANYYAIFRSSSLSVNTSTDLIATSSAITYTNSGLSSNTTYYFAVVGVNESSTGTISNIASTTTDSVPVSSGGGGGGGSGSGAVRVAVRSASSSQPLAFVLDHVEYLGDNQARIWVKLNADTATVRGYLLSTSSVFTGATVLAYQPLVSLVVPVSSQPVTLYGYYYSTTGDISNVLSLTVSTAVGVVVPVPSPLPSPAVVSMPVSVTADVCLVDPFPRNLQSGSKGDDVKKLQTFLNTNGFTVSKTGPGSSGKETSLFGAGTRKALIAFQLHNNMLSDGKFAGETRTLAQSFVPRTPCPVLQKFPRNLQTGSRGDDVKKLQEFLNANGFTVAISGPGSSGQETNFFGASTKKALVAFQKNHNLPPNGLLNSATRGLLNE